MKHSSYLFAGGIGSMVLRFAQNIFVARALGAELLGVWSTIVSFSVIVSSFFAFRTQEALTRYLVEFRIKNESEKIRLLLATAIITDIASNIIPFLFIVIFSPIIATNLAQGQAQPILFILYATSFLARSFDNTWYCVARDLKRLGKQSLRQIVITFVQVALISILYFVQLLNLYTMTILISFISIVNFIVVIIFLNQELKEGYNIKIMSLPWHNYFKSFRQLNQFWNFMFSTYISTTFSSLIKNIDILILGAFTSNKEVGIYQLAKTLSSFLQVGTQSLTSIIYQDFNELIANRQTQKIIQELKRISLKLIPILTLTMILVFLLIYPFILFFYGEEFIKSYPLFIIISLAFTVSLILFWAQALILSLDYHRYRVKVIMLSFFIELFFMLVFLPNFGSFAMAVITSVNMVCINLVFAVKAVKEVRNIIYKT
ncbi:membrane protein [Geminocystis sp. NIES-3708]|uniref:lipopolysaccharide biosynthesis protein n=1 Tax=Geminocystis sp. NIES-3708 TaxID=1615909 RepID=UPI0005FC889A|nr:oligosaccharide flippase family protein [Geminocystis sp. NIES-3708]BAQ62676.1 membrane protein [Geminocystis sp. NIES-3708]